MENKGDPVKLHFERYVPDGCDTKLAPIVFLHGIADSSNTWNKVWKKIADGTRRESYVVDLRNHGKSEWSDLMSFDIFSTDFDHFLKQTSIERCAFIGHSFGGRIGIATALKKPDVFEKVVFEEARIKNMEPEEFRLFSVFLSSFKWIKCLPKTLSEKEARTLFASRVKQMFPKYQGLDMTVYRLPIYQDSNGTFNVNFNTDAFEKCVRDRSLIDMHLAGCEKYDGPALFIYSTKSWMNVVNDETIPDYFPNAEICEFEEDSHVLHYDFSDKFVEIVCNFINS